MNFSLLIFLFIAWTLISKFVIGPLGKVAPAQRGKERASQNSQSQSSERSNLWKDDTFGGQGANQNPQQSLQQRLDAATKTMGSISKVKEFKQGSERKIKRQQIGRGKDFGLSSRHAPQEDQNRHRRDDWGQRGGGEIITTKSLLVLLALGTIVLYVLSQVSPSDLGL